MKKGCSSRSPSYKDYIHTRFFLEDSFGCRVDLVDEAYLREELRARILDEVIYVEGLSTLLI